MLEPLGEKGVEITDSVMTMVDNVNGSVLGGIGLAFFIYAAISMVQKIEESFNYVWYVSKPRSFATRFVEYTAVMLIGSLAIGLALNTLRSIGSDEFIVSMHDNTVIRPVFDLITGLTPYAAVIGIFTFLYMFMPNTNVKLKSALVGGIAGGILWATTSVVFATFLANSTGRQAIYASFAIALTALIWLYLNWLILLIGSQIAFYHQNPAYLRIGRREPRLSNAMRERVALNIMYLVGTEFRNPKNGVTLRSVGRSLRIPTITLAPIAAGLEANGLLTTIDNDFLQPGREMARITLADILAVVRRDGETGSHREPQWAESIDTLGADLDNAVQQTIGERTLSDLLDAGENG